jgi:hypothetical protein
MDKSIDNLNNLVKEAKSIGERITLYKQLREEIIARNPMTSEEAIQKINTLRLIDESLKIMEEWGIF